ncbi:G5 domain-containing protein [bacterium]|nr:G5 domain-containing protein [bacterium]
MKKESFFSVLSGLISVFLFIGLGVAFTKQKQVKGIVSYLCSQKVVLIDEGLVQEREAFVLSKEEFFSQIGLVVYPEDKVSETLPFNLCQGTVVEIKRAPTIYLDVGGKKEIVRSWQDTVADLLKEKKVVLGSKDRVEPSLTDKIKTGMTIKVVRVGERIEEKTVALSFAVKRQPDPDMVKGKNRVIQAGEYGEKKVVYKVVTENGKDVKWIKIEEKVTKEPKTKIIAYGTKPKTTYLATGEARWYIFTSRMIGACNLVPKGTKLLVTNLDNGRSIEVVASGWGAFGFPTVIDLSTSAFEALGGELWQGVLPRIKIEKINE